MGVQTRHGAGECTNDSCPDRGRTHAHYIEGEVRREQTRQKGTVLFCPLCFADEDGGSWGEKVTDVVAGSHCANCGAGNAAVELPRWAVKSIREQASWVGKRYYPNDEDRETAAELRHLRSVAPPMDMTVTNIEHEDGAPFFSAKYAGGNVTVYLRAPDEETARRRARGSLPYPVSV